MFVNYHLDIVDIYKKLFLFHDLQNLQIDFIEIILFINHY